MERMRELRWRVPLSTHVFFHLTADWTLAQNYAPASSAREILRHLRTSNSDLISGVPDALRPDLHLHFSKILEQHGCSQMTSSPQEAIASAQAERASRQGLGQVINDATTQISSFMFNF